ncbi:exonuclease, DNA polymerase III subunit epsilon [Cellulophaga phage phi18:2]|uniref:Exonuclease, DNA polymerase III subunit epsilon n=2 Tax=Cellulophaga phage phi18:1 TaxID=1327982 RepID=S0A0S4_9CAUD|nr:exonuclease, DNA polymerase III subunit epsilon [Cellulophaga phage phi18:1]AGO48458.1 exonuclease, DNA polymerase III subunit epsilon [Cellulophaga phage phi18:1]AGO49174.1 exonuclease, DNA polymerase III subunit epsilon [Cellulophaga phage phi18:2]
MESEKILILDLETTGFDRRLDGITEVGIVSLDLSNGLIEVLYDKVFNPMVPFKKLMSSWIVSKGYMSAKDIVPADRIQGEEENIQRILDSYPLGATAYNNTFDFSFLESNNIEINKKLDCPMRLLRDVVKLPGKGKTYKLPSVEEALAYFFPDEKIDHIHRGASDAISEARIIYEMYKLGIFKINN